MAKRILLFLICSCLIGAVHAQIKLKVGIYSNKNITSSLISYGNGTYIVYGGKKDLGTLLKGRSFKISNSNHKLKIEYNKKVLGSFDTIRFVPYKNEYSFRIQTLNVKTKGRRYQGELILTARSSALQLVNHVELDHYVAGVVESESGAYRRLEYYKVQAIISRTYALKNIKKFKDRGYNLCDNVECQVYHGMSVYDANIIKATNMTKNMVVVDDSANLISTLFHANSGGQTARAEDVWSRSIPYLKSTIDTFSNKGRATKWRKEIPKYKWLNYLKKNYNFPVYDSTHHYAALHFEQTYRKVYFSGVKYGVPLKNIRRDWKLRSTFFNLREEGNKVILEGKGFGHGVGLSQEGAMNMANQNYNYLQILNFYFTNIHIIPLDKVSFYNEKSLEIEIAKIGKP